MDWFFIALLILPTLMLCGLTESLFPIILLVFSVIFFPESEEVEVDSHEVIQEVVTEKAKSPQDLCESSGGIWVPDLMDCIK